MPAEPLVIRKGHCALRAKESGPAALLLELAVYPGSGKPLRRRFEFGGWERLCELIYALDLAMRGELARVIHWHDPKHGTVAMLYFRYEDYGDGDLKGRIYLKLLEGDGIRKPESERTDAESTRVRLTRLEAFKLRMLAQQVLMNGSAV